MLFSGLFCLCASVFNCSQDQVFQHSDVFGIDSFRFDFDSGEFQIRGKDLKGSAARPDIRFGEVSAPIIVGSDSMVIARVPEPTDDLRAACLAALPSFDAAMVPTFLEAS